MSRFSDLRKMIAGDIARDSGPMEYAEAVKMWAQQKMDAEIEAKIRAVKQQVNMQGAMNQYAASQQAQAQNVLGVLGGQVGQAQAFPNQWGSVTVAPTPPHDPTRDLKDLAVRLGIDIPRHDPDGTGWGLLTEILRVIILKTGIGRPDQDQLTMIDAVIKAQEAKDGAGMG